MEKYLDKFRENDCCDMESIQHFDDEFLRETIGMNNPILIRKCAAMREEMEDFKKEYAINKILYGRLVQYGIVTAAILCDQVKTKKDLKLKFKIENDKQCQFLWALVLKLEAQNDIEVQIEGV